MIDFNNLDWTISLVISSEVQVIQQQIYMKDILKNNIEFPEELPPEEPQIEESPETQEEKELKLLSYENNI